MRRDLIGFQPTTTATTMNTAEFTDEASERRSAWRWLVFIVFIFVLNVSFLVVAIYLGAGDHSLSVLPNYKHHAVNADVWQERRASTTERGFVVEPQIDFELNQVAFHFMDRDATSITNLQLILKAFHHTDPGQVRTLTLTESVPGVYRTDWVPHRAGNWQISVESTAKSPVDLLIERTWFVEPVALSSSPSKQP